MVCGGSDGDGDGDGDENSYSDEVSDSS